MSDCENHRKMLWLVIWNEQKERESEFDW